MTSSNPRTAQEYQAALIALQTEQLGLKGKRDRASRDRFRAITSEFFALKAEWKKDSDAGKCKASV